MAGQTNIRRPPQKRAFIGLVGRNIPGDVVVQTLEPSQNGQEQSTTIIQPDSAEPNKKKRGRPSKHASGAMSAAERMRALRERKAEEQKAADNRRALIRAISEWPDWRGKYMTDSPHGKGLLVTGGYGPEKVEQVSAAHERREKLDGGRVRPTGHSLHSHENNKYDLFKEEDWTFVNRAFRRTYGLTKDEAAEYEWQVLETFAYQQAYCSFGFQCQVCDEMVWSAERFAHFRDKHPHLIQEQKADQPNADENEILMQLARKNFVTILASFHCELCEDENAPEDRGFIDLSSENYEPEVWDGDYISFVNLNRGAMVDHLYEKHSRVVSREVREFLQRMTPGNSFKRMERERQKNCRVNHEKLAAEKAAEWKAEILATDRELKRRGDWAAADRPATYPCPGCGKKLPLVIS